MKQGIPVQTKHAPLLGLFLNGFENMRQKMDAPCRRPLLDIAPLIFGKWHYTALANETILSPANLLALDLEKDENQKTEYAYVLNTIPAEEQPKGEFITEYRFSLMEYSTESHPLIDDLKALIAYCTPDCATDENGLLLPKEKSGILKELSLQNDFYLEYLTRLAWLHGLFVPMPSIHTQRLQPAAECETFFSQKTADILFQLGETACTLAAERFNWSIDSDEDIVTPDFFYSLLEHNKEVDHIFIDFYKKVDVSIEEIWKTSPEALSEDEKSILSSFLFTGIMLDKWFLTPMSMFFRFIRPITFSPMRFFTLVNHLAALVLMEHNLGAEIFIPPAYYSLTALGKALFADSKAEETDKQKMPRTLLYDQLLDAVLQEAELRARERMFLMEVVPDVLSIKISPTNDKDIWKIIEIGQDMDVNQLCQDLCSAFYMDEGADYLLSVPDQNGFPMEYSAKGSKRSINKTNGKDLQDLPLMPGSRLLLYPNQNRALALSLEILEKGKGDPYLLYPRVILQSPKVIEQEKFDENF